MGKLHIVMYHYTRDLKNSRYPGIKGMDAELFRNQLEFFKENFNVITMQQAIEAWNDENASLPDNPMLLTFDDGYIDNYTVAMPILKQFGMQGSFFIPGKPFTENVLLDVNKIHFILAASGNIKELKSDVLSVLATLRAEGHDIASDDELYERYAKPNRFDSAETIFVKRILQTAIDEKLRNQISSMLFKKYVGIEESKFALELYINRDQIRVMRDNGMYIALHGYDHYWLGNLPEVRLHEDIDKALDVMDEFIDRDNWVLNYPYGNYSDSVIEYIRSKGCKLGMTTEVRVADTIKDNKYTIPRLDCSDYPPKSEDYRKFI